MLLTLGKLWQTLADHDTGGKQIPILHVVSETEGEAVLLSVLQREVGGMGGEAYGNDKHIMFCLADMSMFDSSPRRNEGQGAADAGTGTPRNPSAPAARNPREEKNDG